MGWHIIIADGSAVGATYITHANELGVFIFKAYQGHGYGKEAVEEMMDRYEGPFLANINPGNEASRKFFEDLGFKMIQVTYAK